MRFISLFSGIGGFDLALERAGFTCDTLCEIDLQARGVLQRHFPHARIIEDVRDVGKETHERGSISLICGGFPCQDLSVAGKRAGLAGERSGLWFEFARVIDELEPQWVVVENVPGLLSSNGGRDFAVIVRWLAERGYGVAWRVLDAQYFGVVQRRRRVFIVGSLGDGRAAQVLFESEGVSRDSEKGREAREGDAGTAAPLTASGDGQVAGALGAEPGAHQQNYIAFQPRYFTRDNKTGGAPSDTVDITNAHKAGDSAPVLAFQSKASATNSLNPSEITPGLDVGKGDGLSVVGAFGVRRLTPTECERLQGFPDGWTKYRKFLFEDTEIEQADSARYRQLGNAVAVPVVEWIAKRIAQFRPTPFGADAEQQQATGDDEPAPLKPGR